MKKVFLCIFSCLLSFFLMSHNVFAFSLNDNVSVIQSGFRSKLETSRWAAGNCSTSPSAGTWVDQLSCVGSLTIYDMRISIPNRTYNAGEYIVIELINSFSSNSQSLHTVWFGASYGGYNPISLISQEFENMDTNNGLVRLYFRVNGTFTDSNLTLAGTNGSWGILTINSGSNGSTDAVLRPATTTIFGTKNDPNYTNSLNDIRNKLDDIKNDIPTAEENAAANADEEEQRTQDVVDQSEQDSQDSQDEVDQATASLLAVGGQVVNVIINTAATNCNLPMKFTHYDMGVVNLCSDMPSNVLDIIRGVSALVFIPVIVNYALYLVNKLVSLYRSFQG